MHIAAIASVLAATPSKSSTTSSGSSTGSFVFPIVVFGLLFVMYRMFMRPRQRAAQPEPVPHGQRPVEAILRSDPLDGLARYLRIQAQRIEIVAGCQLQKGK